MTERDDPKCELDATPAQEMSETGSPPPADPLESSVLDGATMDASASRRQFIHKSARKLAYAAPVVAALAASRPGSAAASGSGS